MIIAVEGADCAGKSTLVKRLTDHLTSVGRGSVTVLHAGAPDPRVDILEQYLKPLADVAFEPLTDVILDRWHLGELVYGPLRRSGSRLTPGQAAYVDLVLDSFGFTGILCDRPTEDLIACYDTRGDDVAERDQLAREAHAFRDVVAKRRRRWHVVNSSELRTEAAWLLTELAVTRRCSPLSPFVRGPSPIRGAYVGPRWPQVLLVGDRRNPADRHTPLPWPFVPWSATSGHWMFEALVAEDVPVERLGFTNACERKPHELHTLWYALGAPKIVALGRNSHTALRAAGVPVTNATNHPQWWRRFRHRDTTNFAREVFHDVVTQLPRREL